MIKVEGLKKIYESKKGTPCVALGGVSFVLPESGMVFIVGKSGSGKSTLLNLLGGLDNVTDGDIVIGERKFSEFSEADYDDYRNNFVGFVFQDFCLIEGMTVFENARLSVDLRESATDDDVRDALRIVELAEYEKRYPKELSGGQKQRVALARALVKKPYMILADEPTGNLDARTAKQVLDSLKEMSKDRLVIIVSHNADDADKYADRIIELADGSVVQDVSRVPETSLPLIDGDKINLPSKRRLTNDELASINELIKAGNAEILQSADDFVTTDTVDTSNEGEYSPEKEKLPFKKRLFLSTKLSRGNRFAAVLTTIMVTALIILLSLCRVFAAFDGEDLIRDGVMKDDSYSFSLYKGYRLGSENSPLETNKQVELTDADIAAFYDAGYEGKVYKLYNLSLALTRHNWNTFELGEHVSYSGEKSPYISFGSGVLECDKEFLDGIYGKGEGGIEVVAGDINETTPRSLIITDYFADCILIYNPKLKSYQDIIDAVTVGHTKFDVKAIIKTDYTERYAKAMAEYERIMEIKSQRERNEALEGLKDDDTFRAFYSEVTDYLSIAYYFGNDYEAQEIAYVQSRSGTSLDNPYVIINGVTYQGKQWAYAPLADLPKGEMHIHASAYNDIMGTDYSAEQLEAMMPFTLTLIDYPFSRSDGDPVYQKTFTVTGISYGPFLLNYSDYLELYSVHLYPHAVYFDNTESAASTYMKLEKSDFFLSDEYYKTIYTIMDVVSVFEDFFLLLYVGLIAVCALLLVTFSRRSVKRRMYEIGVLRALGYKNLTVATLFMRNLVIMSAFIALISIGGVLVLDSTLNAILIENLALMLDSSPIKELTIIKFSILSACIDMLTILVLSFISSLGALSSCRRIKPMNIIRDRE